MRRRDGYALQEAHNHSPLLVRDPVHSRTCELITLVADLVPSYSILTGLTHKYQSCVHSQSKL